MKTRKLFLEGMALSASLTLIVMSYALWKNLPLSALLFIAPLLISMPLLGIVTSRLAAQRISKALLKEPRCPNLQTVFILHLIFTCILIYVIYATLVYYEVNYAILLLPILAGTGGALMFLLIFRITSK